MCDVYEWPEPLPPVTGPLTGLVYRDGEAPLADVRVTVPDEHRALRDRIIKATNETVAQYLATWRSDDDRTD